MSEQEDRELKYLQKGVDRYRTKEANLLKNNKGSQTDGAKAMMSAWYQDLVDVIDAEKKSIRLGYQGRDRRVIAPCIMSIPTSHLASCTLSTVYDMLMSQVGWATTRYKLAYAIGNGMHVESLKKTVSKADWSLLNRRKISRHQLGKEYYIVKAAKKLDSMSDNLWDSQTTQLMGMYMLGLMKRVAAFKVDDGIVEALELKSVYDGIKNTCVIAINPDIRDAMEAVAEEMQHNSPVLGVMTEPPLAWGKEQRGGYLTIELPLVKKVKKTQKDLYKDADMNPLFESANALNSQGMQIIQGLLKEQRKIWDAGGNEVGIPRKDKIPMPIRFSPDNEWLHERAKVHKANDKERGDRHMFHRSLVELEELSNKEFFTPCFLDYRLRSYVHSSDINHQRSDRVRGLFKFSDKHIENICDRSLFWMNVALANEYGIKGTNQDKADWSNDNVHDSNWKEAKHPWAFKAMKDELYNVSRGLYRTSIPIKQDGTANAIQHTSAIMRDWNEGLLSNLTSNIARKPNDVYECIAAETRISMGEDLILGVPIMIDRSMIKKHVLPKSYGCSDITIRENHIQPALEDHIDKKILFNTSWELTTTITKAFKEVCPKTHECMKWITDNARFITAKGRYIMWETPDGLPVVIPHEMVQGRRVYLEGQTIEIFDREKKNRIDKVRCNRAVAACVIQSLDACHMRYTSRAMKKEGLPFQHVHDEYWTTPSCVDRMNVLIREAFIRVHQIPFLSTLYSQWTIQHPDIEFIKPPSLGELEITDVLNSEAFFS